MLGLSRQQLVATCFQQLSILDAGRTNQLAGAAAKTAVDVFAESIRSIGQSIFRYGTHQIKSAAWPVVFVTGNYVSWTGLEAETAVDAGEKFLFLFS